MPDYMLLLRRPADPRPAPSREQAAAILEDYSGWMGRLRAEGRIKAGDKLTDDAGRVMSTRAGRVVATDGPFPESKELVGGFFVIAASSYDEACRIAESCPHFKDGGRIEVRQIDVFG